MDSELTQQISNRLPGNHFCLFYEKDPAEQMQALIRFIQEGLSRDEQFIYIADDQTTRKLEDRLRDSGTHVSEESDRGTLKLWTNKEWGKSGELCSKKKSIQMLQYIGEAANSVFKGGRFAVDMTSFLGPNVSPQQLEHWEGTLNTIFVPGFPGRIVCQYDWSRFSPETMLIALRTHPLAILGDSVYPNCFYEESPILNGKRQSRIPRLDRIASLLERSRAAEKELEAARRRLQEVQVLAAIGTAATKIAHDMTNALNAISATIQLQERYLTKNLQPVPEPIGATIQDLKVKTQRVGALIDELRQFSQPLHLRLEPVNLAEILAEVVHEAICARRHAVPIQFEQRLSEDSLTVMADGEKLRRVFLNLFDNALEAMPEGGKLTFRCYKRESNVCLEIEDTGCGIPKEMKILEPFTTSKPNGWGLGLAIAQQIILAHKGVLQYSSERDQGTTFKISLPIIYPLQDSMSSI